MTPFRNGGAPIEWGKGVPQHGGPASWRRIVPHPDRPTAFAQDIALVVCPNGHESTLSGSVHFVSHDGAVTPSYVCPSAGCDFHDMARLEGWDET